MSSVVDVWCNPPTAEVWRRLPEVARLFVKSGSPLLAAPPTNATKPQEAEALTMSPKQLVALMDREGIDRIMLCAWCRPGQWIFTNEQVLEYTRAYPDRFVGIATVDLDKPVEAVEMLEKAVCEYGFKGLKVLGWLWKLPPNDKLYYPLYVKCTQLGIPFCPQVGHTGPLMPSEPGRPVPYLEEVALTFPDLKIVGGHIGHPWTEEMINLAWKFDNVYIDTSAYLPRYYPKPLVHFMTTHGRDKVLFGTNFPQLSWKRCVESVQRDLRLAPEIYERFMWKNACNVFGLDERQPAPPSIDHNAKL
jgi:predicted TIM-barrel fold metal-dependent hydrolase